jgi:D-proline reductase (dithiol) PrdB
MANPFRQQTDILFAKAFTRWPLLGRLWSKLAPINASTDVPWTPLTKPLADCRLCLITTGGLHLKSDQAFNMDDPKGDPTFRVIPSNVKKDDLTITHNYYDHSDADSDFNILLPLDRMRELAAASHLRGLTPSHYSFMGHIDGPHVATLQREILPELVRKLVAEHTDFVFLTPA